MHYMKHFLFVFLSFVSVVLCGVCHNHRLFGAFYCCFLVIMAILYNILMIGNKMVLKYIIINIKMTYLVKFDHIITYYNELYVIRLIVSNKN